MKQRIQPGGTIDTLTPDELVKLIGRPREVTRIRAPQTLALSATGGGSADVYKVPVGYEFQVRRIVLTQTGAVASDPNTGNVVLTGAGKYVAYMRSGQLIEMGQPEYGANVQVPGVQTWGDQQGPYLRNGEVFGVTVAGLTANAQLSVYVEGILTRPASKDND